VKNSSLTTLTEISLLNFPHLGDHDSWINVYQTSSVVPFNITRVFNVYSKKPNNKGKHAHLQCTQLIICIFGSVNLDLKDGISNRSVELNSGDNGLLIPPGIWVEVEYMGNNSIIMVLCDLVYDENDYIRSWDKFLQFKGIK